MSKFSDIFGSISIASPPPDPFLATVTDFFRRQGCLPPADYDRFRDPTFCRAPFTVRMAKELHAMVIEAVWRRFTGEKLDTGIMGAIRGYLAALNHHLEALCIQLFVASWEEAHENGVNAGPGWHNLGPACGYHAYRSQPCGHAYACGERPKIIVTFGEPYPDE